MDNPFVFVHPPSAATGDFFQGAFHDGHLGRFGSARGDRQISEPQVDEFTEIDDKLLQEFIHATPTPMLDQPPSSVLRELDNESASASDFDPTLQYSPAPSTPMTPVQYDERLLPSSADVSWDHVRKQLTHQRQANTSPLTSELQPSVSTGSRRGGIPHPVTARSCPPSGMLLKHSRTWFHFQEMLKAETQLYVSQPGTCFEFFARVLSSQRENLVKKQYFRIRDLFKVHPPYLSAVLAN